MSVIAVNPMARNEYSFPLVLSRCCVGRQRRHLRADSYILRAQVRHTWLS